MKHFFFSGMAFFCFSLCTNGQWADRSLSNLTSPTFVNQSLTPLNNTLNLGGPTRTWNNLYLNGSVNANGSLFTNGSLFSRGSLFFNGDLYIGDQRYINHPGTENWFVGKASGGTHATGSYNTANGNYTLRINTTGNNNTANGYQALMLNVGGNYNTATGVDALKYNQSGSYNSSFGSLSLYNNNGSSNTANGYLALYGNTTGSNNTASGLEALSNNTTGSYNTGIGSYALRNNRNFSGNTAIGYDAGNNTIGASQSTFLGAKTSADSGLYNITAVGYGAVASASNQVMLGNTIVMAVRAAGTYVIYSDGRFKKDINEEVPGLAFINKLRPVTYHYNIRDLNKYINPAVSNTGKQKDTENEKVNTEAKQKEAEAIKAKEQKLYTGFIAQEVEKAANTLNYDFSGVYKPANDKDVYGLSYSDFVVPLVKSVQELSKENQHIKAEIKSLKTENESTKHDLLDLKAEIKRLRNELAMREIERLKTEVELQAAMKMLAAEIELLKGVISAITKAQEPIVSNLHRDAALEQNVPNPFNNTTTISYQLPSQYSSAQVNIFDYAGKPLKQVKVSGHGKGNIQVDASTFTSGAYRYSLYVDGILIDTKQMILAK